MPNEDSIESEIIEMVSRISDRRQEIHSNTKLLSELDLDSLQVLELIEQIERRFGVDLLKDTAAYENIMDPRSAAEAVLRIRRSLGTNERPD